jgi:hypothetical protein
MSKAGEFVECEPPSRIRHPHHALIGLAGPRLSLARRVRHRLRAALPASEVDQHLNRAGRDAGSESRKVDEGI